MDNKSEMVKIYKLVSKGTDKIYIGTSRRPLKNIMLSLKSGSERKQKQGLSMTKAESFYSLGECNIYILQLVIHKGDGLLSKRKKFYKKKYKNLYI